MTTFTVVWSDEALSQLADLWAHSTNRDLVNRAVRDIDTELRVDPTLKGSPTLHGIRDLVASPLRVLFTISVPDRLVRVVHVATFTN